MEQQMAAQVAARAEALPPSFRAVQPEVSSLEAQRCGSVVCFIASAHHQAQPPATIDVLYVQLQLLLTIAAHTAVATSRHFV